MSDNASLAMTWIERIVREEAQKHELFIAEATSVSNGKIAITRLGATTQEKYYGRLRGFAVAVGEYVICARLGSEIVILGALQNTLPESLITEAPVTNDWMPTLRTMQGLSDYDVNINHTSTQSKAHYIGRATAEYTNVQVALNIPTGGSGFTWAEVAVGTSPDCDINTDAAITTRGYTSVTTPFGSNGQKSIAVTVSGINVGDHLWVIIGAQATSMPQFAGRGSDFTRAGSMQIATARPSTWSPPQTFSASSTSVAPIAFSWQGT